MHVAKGSKEYWRALRVAYTAYIHIYTFIVVDDKCRVSVCGGQIEYNSLAMRLMWKKCLYILLEIRVVVNNG